MVLIVQLYRYVKFVYFFRMEYSISFRNKFVFWYTKTALSQQCESGTYTKFYAVIVCRVYKGSVRFNTIATAFKNQEELNS